MYRYLTSILISCVDSVLWQPCKRGSRECEVPSRPVSIPIGWAGGFLGGEAGDRSRASRYRRRWIERLRRVLQVPDGPDEEGHRWRRHRRTADWEERREYAYTIRAICEIRPPNDAEGDDRSLSGCPSGRPEGTAAGRHRGGDPAFPVLHAARVCPALSPCRRFRSRCEKYVEPDLSMNFSDEMQKEIKEKIVQGATTDVEAIEKILAWMAGETRLANHLPEFAFFNVVDNQDRLAAIAGQSAEEIEQLLADELLRRRDVQEPPARDLQLDGYLAGDHAAGRRHPDAPDSEPASDQPVRGGSRASGRSPADEGHGEGV